MRSVSFVRILNTRHRFEFRIFNLCLVIVSLFFVSSSSVFAAGKAKGFNPDLSANFLGLMQHGSNYSNDRSNRLPHGRC